MPPYTTIPSAALTTVCMSAHSARVHICPTNSPTPPFSRGSIDIDHEKKVDLGVLRGADHDGHVPVSPFSTVDGVCVKLKITLKLW